MGCKDGAAGAKGMTLIELLMVMAMIGILASTAYPIYTHQVLKAHRQQAQTDLLKIQLALEQGFFDGYQPQGVISEGACLVCGGDNPHYLFTIEVDEAGYRILALPRHAQGKDNCEGERYDHLSLNQRGERLPSECW
ncbi:type IV pilin protein [Vibrio sp. WXL103]|uniref:type IV pilin protein n=1 Tax=Vibrio sp. WXL103 TaxID=3450710 RepID=UPI003EC5E8B0